MFFFMMESPAYHLNGKAQGVLAMAFDIYCSANGYKNSLSTIEEWLGDSRSNVRRAVSETGRFTIPMLLYCRRAGSSGKYLLPDRR